MGTVWKKKEEILPIIDQFHIKLSLTIMNITTLQQRRNYRGKLWWFDSVAHETLPFMIK